MGGWDLDGPAPSERDERMAENGRRLTLRVAALVEKHASTGLAGFAVTRELLCELNAIAMAGDPDPGIVRTHDNHVGPGNIVVFQPPPWRQVEGHITNACEYIKRASASATTLHVAAYSLWVFNWIHAFRDGNGRTARSLSYALLCIGYGRSLPGSPTVPEQIRINRYPYWDALQAADAAWAGGIIDVSEMEALLDELLQKQLSGATPAT